MDDIYNLFGLAALSAAKVSVQDTRLQFVRRFVGAEQPSIHEVIPKTFGQTKQYGTVTEKVIRSQGKRKQIGG